MITCQDPDLSRACRMLRSHGQEKKYYHPSLGLNYRMTEVEGAIGIVQLGKLDDLVSIRRRNAAILDEGLSAVDGIRTPIPQSGSEHSYHQYTVVVDEAATRTSRNDLARGLMERGIGSAVHYPRSIHQQPAFERLYGRSTLPVCEDLSKYVLSLPVHPALNPGDVEMVVESTVDTIASS